MYKPIAVLVAAGVALLGATSLAGASGNGAPRRHRSP